YNLYFTPDGRSAIVVAERLQRLDFRDPQTWKLQKLVPAGEGVAAAQSFEAVHADVAAAVCRELAAAHR
ncbi:MAG: hypothetical protein LC790_19610, partial [Actinobacteria bacterium]|nr:hypothetical protein [Actinomycetota bacterium]